MKIVLASLTLLLLSAGICSAQQTVSPHGLTFTLDPARTEPGTVEVEFGTLSGNSFDMPWIFKFTGDSQNFLLKDTEWAFIGGVKGDSFNLLVRRPLHRTENFAVAVSPRFTFPVGDKPLSGLAILASFSHGFNSFAVNGEVNQTSEVVRKAVSGDYARTLGETGFWNKLVVFGGTQINITDKTLVSTGQGFAFRPKPNLEVEVVLRQMDLNGNRHLVLLTDFIFNLGRVQ